jgi:predicted ATP-dependent protease
MGKAEAKPQDWCYVHNFQESYEPRAIGLPPGRGRELQQDMEALIDHARHAVPRVFESESYGARRDETLRGFDRMRADLLEGFSKKVREAGFQMQNTPLGILLVPVKDDRPLTEAEMEAIPQAEREKMGKSRDALQEELTGVMKQVREVERTARTNVKNLDRKVAHYVVGELIEDLKQKYQDLPDVLSYFSAVETEIVDSFELFKSAGQQPPQTGPEGIPAPPIQADAPFRRFKVNLFVDNAAVEGAPVVVELNPTFINLFGRVEKEAHFGTLYTDFLMIRPGALQRANGGYLVLPVEETLRSMLSWDGLKLALRTREVTVEDFGERLGYTATKSLRPQAIPLDLKVILVGRSQLYHLLHVYDEEFPELFKVKAEFETRTDLNESSVTEYSAFLSGFCAKQSLRPLDRGAIGRILEHASRLAEDQRKLSTHFGLLTDIVREAHFWATQEEAPRIGATHVRRAIEQKAYRSRAVEERIRELIERGSILIDTQGEAVGQVNGLAVIGLGDYAFGKPNRITVVAGPGRSGVVDIEREVELGGPIHSKGVLILSGFLAERFARERPLSLSARLVFEQNYSGVDGDSASSTELYAILSALAGLPIRQGIAVTGSINQRGEVQAIGGVNHKVEGFFDVCRVKGLTGRQGIVIPKANVENLMLREDVVDAVRSGIFHLWAVAHIDEGIEIITGVPAGRRAADGEYPIGTVNFLVEKRLRELDESLRRAPATDGRPVIVEKQEKDVKEPIKL